MAPLSRAIVWLTVVLLAAAALFASTDFQVSGIRIQHLTRHTQQRTHHEQQAVLDVDAAFEAAADEAINTDSEVEVEAAADTETEAEAETEQKKYEGIEHEYAGVGVMTKRGDGSSRWIHDSNGIGGQILLPLEDTNEGELKQVKEVTEEGLYDEVRDAAGTKMYRWTYPQIVPIFGDYIAPQKGSTVICKPATAAERKAMFEYHFNDVWSKTASDAYMKQLQSEVLDREHIMVKRSHKRNVAELQTKLQQQLTPDQIAQLKLAASEFGIDALFRKMWNERANFTGDDQLNTLPKEYAGTYGEMSALNNNDDHWHAGGCAEKSYIAGHSLALETAFQAGFDWALAVELKNVAKTYEKGLKGVQFGPTNLYDYAITVSNDRQRNARSRLRKAYAMDAAADHFLTDMFSAGHIRTPRPELHTVCNSYIGGFAGLTSNVMHDEDNLNGLLVTNKKGDIWWAFGDKRYFDDLNAMNRAQIGRTVEATRNEVWLAFYDGNSGGLKWLDSVNAKASKTASAPRVPSGLVTDTGKLGAGTGFWSYFTTPKLPVETNTPLPGNASPRAQFEKITGYLSLRDDTNYLNVLTVDDSKFEALQLTPRPEFIVGTSGALDIRMALENTCPRYRIKPGTNNVWQIRTGRAEATGNVRPAIATVLKVPSTRDKYASAELFPTFVSLKAEDFKVASTVNVNDNAEYSTDCEYEDMTSSHCCEVYASGGEVGNRFRPILETPQTTFIPTYRGECKNVGYYGSKHPSNFTGNAVAPKKVKDFLDQTRFKYY